ncbi:unnamed protein product, partial [Adineta steineri]
MKQNNNTDNLEFKLRVANEGFVDKELVAVVDDNFVIVLVELLFCDFATTVDVETVVDGVPIADVETIVDDVPIAVVETFVDVETVVDGV